MKPPACCALIAIHDSKLRGSKRNGKLSGSASGTPISRLACSPTGQKGVHLLTRARWVVANSPGGAANRSPQRELWEFEWMGRQAPEGRHAVQGNRNPYSCTSSMRPPIPFMLRGWNLRFAGNFTHFMTSRIIPHVLRANLRAVRGGAA